MFVMMALGILVPSACNKLSTNNENGQVDLNDLLSKEDKLYQDLTVQSAYKGQKMTYSVWLPNGYDETKTYPFLYLFHGYEYGDQSHLDRCWVEKGNAREIAKQYVKDGGVPMVIVMPNGLSDFYSGSWEQYFHEELMPKVEEGFKCNGKRAIAGLSMGGYGTLYHALKYPRKFTYAYAMSPATAVTFTAFIDAQADKKVFPPFTIEVGTEDGTVNNTDSETLATYMKDQGMTCEWISRPGTHDWKFWQECLPKTLKRVGESFK